MKPQFWQVCIYAVLCGPIILAASSIVWHLTGVPWVVTAAGWTAGRATPTKVTPGWSRPGARGERLRPCPPSGLIRAWARHDGERLRRNLTAWEAKPREPRMAVGISLAPGSAHARVVVAPRPGCGSAVAWGHDHPGHIRGT